MNIQQFENYHEKNTLNNSLFPYDTYLCSIPLDFVSVPLHWHDEFELIYIKKGEGIVSVNLQDYHVLQGDLIYIIPGSLHEIKQIGDNIMEYENIMVDTYIIDSDTSDSLMHSFIAPLLDGRIAVPKIISKSMSGYKRIIAPIDECDNIRTTMPEGHELYLKGQLFLFFYNLFSEYKKESVPPQKSNSLSRMKKILKFVELNYGEHISISDIANEVGLSESHFMKYFKETMGTSFIDYLKEYRLKMAARLLKCSDDTILRISEEVGFENVSYFNRSFKTKYGVTPSQYKNN
ncbi:MAG: AraC family transcriptional regulator [Lachnospiraceae bacterium]|nr:AraC family transcriptional regulator [Lachnospiraceae bacterium]